MGMVLFGGDKTTVIYGEQCYMEERYVEVPLYNLFVFFLCFLNTIHVVLRRVTCAWLILPFTPIEMGRKIV